MGRFMQFLNSLEGLDRRTVRTTNGYEEEQSDSANGPVQSDTHTQRADYSESNEDQSRYPQTPRPGLLRLTFSIKPLSESSPVASPLSFACTTSTSAQAQTRSVVHIERSDGPSRVWEDMVGL
jgi:hypothetical protein